MKLSQIYMLRLKKDQNYLKPIWLIAIDKHLSYQANLFGDLKVRT